ncbi:MAG TPA: hypothetical protein VK358_10770 [Longimicrobium sp.]|nr:hypothetical protein [Longimicrobium sp.]
MPRRSNAACLARAALLVALLAGCARAAGPSAPAPAQANGRAVAAAVVLCTTTEAELRRALGEPTRDGRLRDARVLSWIVGEDDVVSYLAVLLDARGVVVDLYWDLPTEIGWAPADQCAGRGAMPRA